MTRSTGYRAEIEGLRAIAVLSVVLFHIWPSRLPGGYVGVDVFFVISGFLITGKLFAEASSGKIDLMNFYRRRAWRLLPAASVVLIVVTLAVPLVLPLSSLAETNLQVIASATYWQNWRLAWQAVDYLGAEATPSPVQHFWSLSVEEQYYILWPLVLSGLIVAARAINISLRLVVSGVLTVVILCSLAASITITIANPSWAYFVTHTRIWELAMGGLLAVLPLRLPLAARRVIGVLGVAMVLAAVMVFTKETAFPGYMALVPTLGAACIILSGNDVSEAWSVSRILGLSPLQFVGGTSYAVYLWHWPILTFYQSEAGGDTGPVAGVLVVATTFLCAYLSKIWVEDRYRGGLPGRQRPLSDVVLVAVASVAIALSVSVTMFLNLNRVAYSARSYPGAEAIYAGAEVPAVTSYWPPQEALAKDIFSRACLMRVESSPQPKRCDFGNPEGTFHVVLIGDSHAHVWAAPMAKVAERNGWRLTTYFKSSCPFTFEMVKARKGATPTCPEWSRQVLNALEEATPDLIVISRFRSKISTPEGLRPFPIDLQVEMWEHLEKIAPVIAIADSPEWEYTPTDCFTNRSLKCELPIQDVRADDIQVSAVAVHPTVALLDLNDVICPEDLCRAIVGNVVVWRDKHHLSATFATSLAGALDHRMQQILKREGSRP